MSEATENYNPDFQSALDYESKEVGLGLEDLMAEIMQNADVREGSTFDEMKIRRMILALRHLKRETEDLKRFKKAVVADWDKRIKDKEKNMDQIKDVIHDFLVKENKGKALSLDVGTVSVRKVAPNFDVTKEQEALLRTYLEEAGMLGNFLKPAELDVSLVKKELVNRIESKSIPVESLQHVGTYQPESTTLSIRMK